MPAYAGRARAYSPLKADIEDFVRESENRMARLLAISLEDVVNEVQQPVAKGGRMRVRTGFLRASGRASLKGFPSGPSVRESDVPNSYAWDSEAVSTTLNSIKFGDTFYFGWTANYARYRELYDGFLEGAMQNWARIVAFNTDTLRKRIK